ncbi:hypothetical protein Acal01_00060 [Acinetobacter calcoaceticus]|uniref:hypothetical protein n=1 Tax=Acinetobacter calcoaceticus TaxID=471 RepID=UPI0002EFB17E|nr:hypothetical protein [Acinetobacter calcoaceticus]
MSRLADMEELLLKIESNEKRDFMEEALTCYMNKAYRGCIVLSFIVLFEDIFNKLKPLIHTNKAAKDIYDFIKPKKEKQLVFENDLINKLESNNLIDKLDSEFAKIIIKLRNKSAHPSGHSPSPEEARYIFSEVINRFLSQPILSTNVLVDSILEKLKDDNFFTNNSMKSIKDVVIFETDKLHTDAIPYLIDRLIENFTTQDKKFKKNINYFFSGFISILTSENLSIVRNKVVEGKSTDKNFNLLILKLIGLRPELFKDSNNVTQERVKVILLNRIDSIDDSVSKTAITHPLYIIKSLRSAYESNIFNINFEKIIQEIINKWEYEIEIKAILIDNEDICNKYFKSTLEKAGSRTFDIANYFIENINNISNILNDLINDRQAAELILNIISAAKNGARKSTVLSKSRFRKIPEIYERAKNWVDKNNSEYEDICNKLYLDCMDIKNEYF